MPKAADKGPYIQENWMAANRGEPAVEIHEYPLFTDARVTGQVASGLGPYQLLNAFKEAKLSSTPSVILRVGHHVAYDPAEVDMGTTDASRYHGGTLADEVAGLVSLCLGIRLKAGSKNRVWSEPLNDPKGTPYYMEAAANPILPAPPARNPMLPRLLAGCSLNDAVLIAGLPSMQPADANAILRAARLYQDAVWIAESQPELSWLMLVSAIEVAADHWRQTEETPTQSLTRSRPEVIGILKAAGGNALVEAVAAVLARYVGSTRSFVNFTVQFAPPPPPDRPEEYLRISWKNTDLKRMMKTIYDWRSRALHGGTPFPHPMCGPPVNFGGGYAEKPLGLATHSRGGTWRIKDTPMLLHSFEYIVRHALLAWWKTLTPNPGSPTSMTQPPAKQG